MRTSTIVMIGFAILFGVLAVFLAQTWLNHQSEMRMKSLEAQQKQVVTKTVVVAARALPQFGQRDDGAGAARELVGFVTIEDAQGVTPRPGPRRN